MGDDCIIHQGVTLGGGVARDGAPTVGNRVYFGVNAVALGAIIIGDDAKVGACTLVLGDVPPGYTAVGNPARLLPPKAMRVQENEH